MRFGFNLDLIYVQQESFHAFNTIIFVLICLQDIPFRFAKTHFKEDNSEIVLQHSDGRTWTVCCRIKIFSQRAYFNIRWNAFVQDNNLKVGNICVFELIKSAELVVKVSIIRAGDSRPSVG